MKTLFLSAAILFSTLSYAGQPPSHDLWDVLLKKHVTSTGKVSYTGFKADSKNLNAYLTLLETHAPASDWSKNEKMAYWINAYNAYTIKLILDNWPVKSIKDIAAGKPWDKKFITIGGKSYTLNNIEHDILRKMGDPRIHFGVVCASFSCPQLRNGAFTADNLSSQLSSQAKKFINDPKRNKVGTDSVQLSKIFDWFSGDFTKDGNIINYINKYSTTKANANAKVSYLTYDWSLND